MTKKIYIKLAVFLVAISIISMSNIFASNATNINDNNTNINENRDVENNETKNDENYVLTEEEIKQKEELNNIIKELIKGIKTKVKNMDESIESLRDIEEYQNYPAIRLNVDTPIFGLDSVVNSKLKIRQDVCATDVAKGYSIKYIIKNNSIKLPDKYIAGIIVSTRDVKFDDTISLTDANSAVLKLMQYTKIIDNTIEFLNNQTNKIFKGYIEKAKSENILDIQRKLNKLNEKLLNQDENLCMLHIILTNEEDIQKYNEKIKQFNEISKKIKDNRKKVDNILISNEQLTKVQKEVLELESTMIDFSLEVEEKLNVSKENIDEEKILIALQKELKEREKSIEDIVEKSVTKKVVEKLENTNETDNDSSNNQIDNGNSDEQNNVTSSSTEEIKQDSNNTVEEIKNYDIVSKNVLTLINDNVIKVINEKVENKIKENEENEKNKEAQENSENNDVEQEDEEEKLKKKKQENENFVKELFNLYKDYIVKENKFYFDNINYTLKNTTSKISDLSKYTKSDILEEMRYIYLELPSSLENYLDNNNLNSTIETKNLSNSLNKELTKLLNVYVKTSKIYDELNVDEIKSKA